MTNHHDFFHFEISPEGEPLETKEQIEARVHEILEKEKQIITKADIKEWAEKNKCETKTEKFIAAFMLTTLLATNTATFASEVGRDIPSADKKTDIEAVQKENAAETMQRADVRAFSRLQEEKKVLFKIDQLKEMFADSGQFAEFLKQKRIEDDLMALEVAEKDFKQNGALASAVYQTRWKERPAELQSLDISGFENILGFSNEELAKTLSSMYTDMFLKNARLRIRYFDYQRKDAMETVHDMGDYIQINIFKSPKPGTDMMTPKIAVWILQHALPHLNDWRLNRALTSAERISMLYDTAHQFLKDRNRFKGFQEIRAEETGEKTDAYEAVCEHWADMAREYVRNPDRFAKQYPHDYALAKKWMERMSYEPQERIKREIADFIQQYYLYPIDAEKLRNAKLEDFAIDKTGERILDKYSGYESPEIREKLYSVPESYGGIGANFIEENGSIFTLSVYEHGPAWQAGLQAGDIILSIRNEATEEKTDLNNISLSRALTFIRGEIGSKISAIIERDGRQLILGPIERLRTKIQLMEAKEIKDGIFYIRIIGQFTEGGMIEWEKAVSKIYQSGAYKAFVVDLRGNRGGLGVGALKTVWPFLNKQDQLLITEQMKDGEKNEILLRDIPDIFREDWKKKPSERKKGEWDIFFKQTSGIFADCPVVVLLNNDSASASEIVGGTMKEAGRAEIIGTISVGKAVAQKILPLSNGHNFRLTTSEFLYGDKKRVINGVGIVPDIQVKWEVYEKRDDPKQYAAYLRDFGSSEKDPQLKRALEALEEKLSHEKQ